MYKVSKDYFPKGKNTVSELWASLITKDDFIWSEHSRGSHTLFYGHDPEASCPAFCRFSNKKAFDAFIKDFNLQDRLNNGYGEYEFENDPSIMDLVSNIKNLSDDILSQ